MLLTQMTLGKSAKMDDALADRRWQFDRALSLWVCDHAGVTFDEMEGVFTLEGEAVERAALAEKFQTFGIPKDTNE